MSEIIIEQTSKNTCQVTHGGVIKFQYKRVACKAYAAQLHKETGDPVFNLKKSGAKVLVHASTN